MAHSRSAKKRIRQNVRRRSANRAAAAAMRTAVKKLRKTVEGNDKAAAAALLAETQQVLDKAARHRRIHPNKAARLKSRFARRVNSR